MDRAAVEMETVGMVEIVVVGMEIVETMEIVGMFDIAEIVEIAGLGILNDK